jgi:hypothetical protein
MFSDLPIRALTFSTNELLENSIQADLIFRFCYPLVEDPD